MSAFEESNQKKNQRESVIPKLSCLPINEQLSVIMLSAQWVFLPVPELASRLVLSL